MNDMKEELLSSTVAIASAYLSNNHVQPADLGTTIRTIYDTLSQAVDQAPVGQQEPAAPLTPAVSIRSSVKPDYIVCLEDGKKLKMLKRHLATVYNLTPDQYRARWGLPADYPMVAPNYSEKRKQLAVTIGLGRKPVKTGKKAA